MKESLVSIIMPAYNSEKFISEGINSVLAQTYQNWELLVADNKSNDATEEIIKEYAAKDSRIKYVEAIDKQGAAYARNMAIRQAQGNFIAFLDSDDQWLPEKLTKQISFMQKEDLSLSYTYYETFGDKQITLKSPAEVSYNQLLKLNVIGCSTAIYNVKALGEKHFMPLIKIGEDWCLWCDILEHTNRPAKCLEEVLTKYRVEDGSLSSDKKEAAYYRYWILRNYFKFGRIKSFYYFCHYAFEHAKRIIFK